MTNPTPPEPRQPQLGFDEWVGILVAFGTIGAILAFTLLSQEKGGDFQEKLQQFEGERELPSLSEEPIVESIPPRVSETIPPTEIEAPITSEILEPEDVAVIPVLPETEADAPDVVPPEVKEPRQTLGIIQPLPSPVPPPQEEVDFSDLPEGFWASPYIYALAEQNILSGFPDNTFRPNQSLTRAEFASTLNKAFEQSQNLPVPNFEDISQDFWAYSDVQETAEAGFLRGYPNDTFKPGEEIPRVQVLVALVSGLGLQPQGNVEEILQVYQDAEQIPDYAREEVAAATEAGLVVNPTNPSQLNPTQPATRAEVAAWTYQALAEAGKVEEMESDYVVEP